MPTPDILAAEREFHDAHYATIAHAPTLAEFLVHHRPIFTEPYWRHFHAGGIWCESAQLALRLARPSGDWRGVRVLDVGSGTGYLSLWLAHLGAEVVGVELSPVGAELARNAARRYGLSAHFHAASVETIPEPDQSFDVLVGFGVLHHLVKYPAAARELARVIRPDGIGTFQESWWENPVLRAMRKRLTQFDEEAGDAELTTRTLHDWAGVAFHLTIAHRSLLYAAKRLLGHGPTLRVLAALDRPLLHIPGLRRWGAEAVIVMKPRRHIQSAR